MVNIQIIFLSRLLNNRQCYMCYISVSHTSGIVLVTGRHAMNQPGVGRRDGTNNFYERGYLIPFTCDVNETPV